MAGNKVHSLHRSEGYIYYYRRAIPQSLRTRFNNKWEIKRSLKTREKSQAIIRHNHLNIEVEQLFKRAGDGEVMTEESLESLNLRLRAKIDQEAIDKDGFLDSMLSGIILALRGRPAHIYEDKSKTISPIHIEIDGNQLKTADGSVLSNFVIAMALEYANQIDIPPMIDETRFSPKKLVAVEPQQEDYPIDIAAGVRAEIEELINADAPQITPPKPQAQHAPSVKADGGIDTKALAGLVAEALNDIKLKDFEPIPFSEMMDRYLAFANYENKKTEKAYRNEFLCFIDVCGDVLSTDITRKMITKYRDLLVKLPKQAMLKYPDTPLTEVAEMGFPKDKLVSAGTADKYIDRLSRMFKWAVDNSHMAVNLTPNMKMDKDDEKKKVPFDTADLQQYFMNSPVHRDRITTGQKMEMFWIPLIALFSAARIEEICSLQITDVYAMKDDRTGDEAWVFDLNKGEGIKSLKNDPAIRHIPIHSELIKIGFLDYFEDRKSRGCQTLWNLSSNAGRKNDRYSQLFGKRHRSYLRNQVEIKDVKKTFHSFRHTAIHALRENSELREDYFRALVGHGQEGTTGKDYFAKLGVAVLQPTLEGIKYPLLDLSHLYKA